MADFLILAIYIKRLCTSFTYYNNKRFYNCFNIVAMQFPKTVWWNVDRGVKHKYDVISYELKTRSKINQEDLTYARCSSEFQNFQILIIVDVLQFVIFRSRSLVIPYH